MYVYNDGHPSVTIVESSPWHEFQTPEKQKQRKNKVEIIIRIYIRIIYCLYLYIPCPAAGRYWLGV